MFSPCHSAPILAVCAAALLQAQPIPAPKLPDASRSWLTLDQVLASVEKNYPPLLIALRDRVIADADVTVPWRRVVLTWLLSPATKATT